MCLNPIKIKNNSLDFDASRDADFFYVPCGKCYQCQKAKTDDYVFRLIAEKLTTNSQVFYYTLTFNDDHLPNVEIEDIDGNIFTYDCFDKPLVQKFIKRLRKYLFDKLNIKLRYFLTSEFGEKYHRPHHHVIFYIQNGSISPSLFRNLITWFWSVPNSKKVPDNIEQLTSDDVLELLKNKDGLTRSLGFNKAGNNFGLVDSYEPLSYCAKYVAKDIYFEKYFVKLDYFKQVHTIGLDCRIYDWRFLKNNCFPFTLMSSNFGVRLLDKLSFDDYVKSSYDVIWHNGEVRTFKIPMYFKRKALFISGLNDNGNVHYMLNKLGYDVKKAQLDNRIHLDVYGLKDIPNLIEENPLCCEGLPYQSYDIYYLFKNMSMDEARLVSEYRNFYRNKLHLDFNLDFDKDFELFKDMQCKFRKAPWLFDVTDIYKCCFDVFSLEEICKIYDKICRFFNVKKINEKIHNENLNKQFAYGQRYIQESEVKVL